MMEKVKQKQSDTVEDTIRVVTLVSGFWVQIEIRRHPKRWMDS